MTCAKVCLAALRAQHCASDTAKCPSGSSREWIVCTRGFREPGFWCFSGGQAHPPQVAAGKTRRGESESESSKLSSRSAELAYKRQSNILQSEEGRALCTERGTDAE